MPSRGGVRRTTSKIPQLVAATQTEMYKGPLPHPEHLAKYEKLYPGASEKIFVIFEKQANHRMGLEKTVIMANIANEKRGQHFGFILALMAIVGGVVLTALGKDVIGISSILVSLVSLTTIFIVGKAKSKQQLQDKA